MHNYRNNTPQQQIVVRSGGGTSLFYLLGMVLAGLCSWQINGAIGWAIVHSIFSWFYILYLVGGCGGGIGATGLF